MEWQVVAAMIVAAPLILVPVALIWYLNIGGIFAAVRRAQRASAANKGGDVAPAGQKD